MPRARAYPDLAPRDADADEPGSFAAAWAEHVAAGRIGTPAPADPAIVARRTANDAVFRARARRHRLAERAQALRG